MVVPRIPPPTITVANATANVASRKGELTQDEIKTILGGFLIENAEPSDALVKALVERIEVLDGKDATLAATLRRIMLNWKGTAVNSLFLRDLSRGKAGTNAVVRLLSARRELREKQRGEIFDARAGGNPVAHGITACLLDEAGDFSGILDGQNQEAKIALFACARLVRAQLNVPKAAENLKSPNKMLALAAERYLEAEDSVEARRMILAHRPNEARILGATTHFAGEGDFEFDDTRYLYELFVSVAPSYTAFNIYSVLTPDENLKATEERLQNEVKKNPDLIGVYSYAGNFIEIYPDRAVFGWEENKARYRERVLTGEEFENFKNYLASQRVDELTPFLSDCEGCQAKQLLMLGKAGGRRVYVRTERLPQFFVDLEEMFEQLKKSAPGGGGGKLRYYLEKNIAGLEILFADEILKARAVWKNGEDFRVLIDDVERRRRIDKEHDMQDRIDRKTENFNYERFMETSRKRREQREYENFSWHKFDKNKSGDLADQPAEVEFIRTRDGLAVPADAARWRTRAGNIEVRADHSGLYKLSGGAALAKIRDGNYSEPVVSADGRWAIALKYSDKRDDTFEIVRVNLQTNREFEVKLNEEAIHQPAGFIASLNKFLIFSGDYYEERAYRNGKYYLLDAETGAIQATKGDVRPLIEQTFRSLQPVVGGGGKPDEFWTALPDAEKRETEFGVYNAKTLTFKPLLKIPQIEFSSMEMWVEGGRIYFAYEGQLLSLPLPKNV